MNRNEFLNKLKESLELSLDKEEINSQIDYYDKYISDEIKKGRTEKEVLDELGDPRLIAKTIKTVNGKENVVNANDNNYEEKHNSGENNNNKSTFTYMNSNNTIGCVIGSLILFVILMGLLRILGFATSLIFGVGPFGIFFIILLIWLLNGRR